MRRERPYTLIAELTYRCPLRCPYCSNPAEYRGQPALGCDEWVRVFREAEALGVVQVHLTGGEPLLRDDLEELVAEAKKLELYTTLITSGIPLTRQRLARLRDFGLDGVQLSFQGPTAESSDLLAGSETFESKLDVARWVKDLRLPLTVNVVMHRRNLDRTAEVIELAERLRADRLELANVQYIGWALLNRRALLPTREQLEQARATAGEAKERLRGRMEVIFVLADYYADVPKTCMDGWGRRYIVVTPDGLVLPCHAAHSLPGAKPSHVADGPLSHIWEASELFQQFRGDRWMPPPCRTCDRRTIDFGGCRCQAYWLTGDAASTDPACVLAPHHNLVREARAEAQHLDAPIPFKYRHLTLIP